MKKNILRKHNFLEEVTFEGQNYLEDYILEDYLRNHKQRTKVDFFIAFGKQYFPGYLKALYMDLVLFNMCGMFLILKGTYFTDYADDNTPFPVRDKIKDVKKALEETEKNLVNWFSNNEMKVNTDKCHLLLNSQKPNTLKIRDLHRNNPPKTFAL